MSPEKIVDLRVALKNAHNRNGDDGFAVLAAVAGIPVRRIKAIMNGAAEPTLMEFTTLSTLR